MQESQPGRRPLRNRNRSRSPRLSAAAAGVAYENYTLHKPSSHRLKFSREPTKRVRARDPCWNPRRLSTFSRGPLSCDTFIPHQHLHNDPGQGHTNQTTCAKLVWQSSRLGWDLLLLLLRDFCGNQASWCQIILKCLDRLFSFFFANNLICYAGEWILLRGVYFRGNSCFWRVKRKLYNLGNLFNNFSSMDL